MNLTELSYSMKDFEKVDIKKSENYARIINYSSCITANIWNAAGIVFTSERIAKNLTLVWNVHHFNRRYR